MQLSMNDLSMRFGARILFEDVRTTFISGRRYAITGPNGALNAQAISKGRTARLDLGVVRNPGIYLAKQSDEVIGGGIIQTNY